MPTTLLRCLAWQWWCSKWWRRLYAQVWRPDRAAHSLPCPVHAQTRTGMEVVPPPLPTHTPAGVVFTVVPTGAGHPEFVLEAVWGLGEGLVSGDISPERVVYDWSLGVPTAHNRVPQATKVVPTADPSSLDAKGSGGAGAARSSNSRITVVPCDTKEQSVGPLGAVPGLVTRLVDAGHAIAKARAAPQDVEWCWDGHRLLVVQTRPVTDVVYDARLGVWHMVLAVQPGTCDETMVGQGYGTFAQQFQVPSANAAVVTSASIVGHGLRVTTAAAVLGGVQWLSRVGMATLLLDDGGGGGVGGDSSDGDLLPAAFLARYEEYGSSAGVVAVCICSSGDVDGVMEAVMNLAACLDVVPRVVAVVVALPVSRSAQSHMDSLAGGLAGVLPVPCVLAALTPVEQASLRSLCTAAPSEDRWLRLFHRQTAFLNSRAYYNAAVARQPAEYDRGAICARITDFREVVADGGALHTTMLALGLDLCPAATRAGMTTPAHVVEAGTPPSLPALLPVIQHLIDLYIDACGLSFAVGSACASVEADLQVGIGAPRGGGGGGGLVPSPPAAVVGQGCPPCHVGPAWPLVSGPWRLCLCLFLVHSADMRRACPFHITSQSLFLLGLCCATRVVCRRCAVTWPWTCKTCCQRCQT